MISIRVFEPDFQRSVNASQNARPSVDNEEVFPCEFGVRCSRDVGCVGWGELTGSGQTWGGICELFVHEEDRHDELQFSSDDLCSGSPGWGPGKPAPGTGRLEYLVWHIFFINLEWLFVYFIVSIYLLCTIIYFILIFEIVCLCKLLLGFLYFTFLLATSSSADCLNVFARSFWVCLPPPDWYQSTDFPAEIECHSVLIRLCTDKTFWLPGSRTQEVTHQWPKERFSEAGHIVGVVSPVV